MNTNDFSYEHIDRISSRTFDFHFLCFSRSTIFFSLILDLRGIGENSWWYFWHCSSHTFGTHLLRSIQSHKFNHSILFCGYFYFYLLCWQAPRRFKSCTDNGHRNKRSKNSFMSRLTSVLKSLLFLFLLLRIFIRRKKVAQMISTQIFWSLDWQAIIFVYMILCTVLVWSNYCAMDSLFTTCTRIEYFSLSPSSECYLSYAMCCFRKSRLIHRPPNIFSTQISLYEKTLCRVICFSKKERKLTKKKE